MTHRHALPALASLTRPSPLPFPPRQAEKAVSKATAEADRIAADVSAKLDKAKGAASEGWGLFKKKACAQRSMCMQTVSSHRITGRISRRRGHGPASPDAHVLIATAMHQTLAGR